MQRLDDRLLVSQFESWTFWGTLCECGRYSHVQSLRSPYSLYSSLPFLWPYQSKRTRSQGPFRYLYFSRKGQWILWKRNVVCLRCRNSLQSGTTGKVPSLSSPTTTHSSSHLESHCAQKGGYQIGVRTFIRRQGTGTNGWRISRSYRVKNTSGSTSGNHYWLEYAAMMGMATWLYRNLHSPFFWMRRVSYRIESWNLAFAESQNFIECMIVKQIY